MTYQEEVYEQFPICNELQRRLGFGGIGREDVHHVLPGYKSRLMEAVEQSDGEFSWADIVEKLQSGLWQLWITPKSALVTCIRDQGQMTLCVLVYMGGVLQEVEACLPGIMEWARVNGCQKLHIEGRKGWGRALEEFGAELRYHVYSIDLED